MPSLRRLRLLPLLLVALASGAAWGQSKPARKPKPSGPPAVQPQRPAQLQHRDAKTQDEKALSDAVRRAERNGQVLSAEQVQYDGRDVNRVKIVDSRGRVRVYWDDPAAQGRGNDRQGGDDKGGKKPREGDRTRSDDDDDPTL